MSSRSASVIGLVAVALVVTAALSGAHPTAAAPSPPAAAPANTPAAVVGLPEPAVPPGALSLTLRATRLREEPALATMDAWCTRFSERCLKVVAKNMVFALMDCMKCINSCWSAIDLVERHPHPDEDRWFKVMSGCEEKRESLSQF